MTKEQRKTLSEFFNGLSIAWFTTGVIVPYFSKNNLQEKMIIMIIGLLACYFFITIALNIARSLDNGS